MISLSSRACAWLRLAFILLGCCAMQISTAQTPHPQSGDANMHNPGLWSASDHTQNAGAPHVRIAQLEVDPDHLAEFKAVLMQSVSTSVRVEPGVYTLYAVALKDHPNRFLVFEMYKDEATYEAHRETAHFRKFFEATQTMVTSRTFLDVDPVVLGAKAYWHPTSE
ncbi:putative quinol monooxygenase [Burkholderia cepacia]|uniref:putative quinol monooxygenase n=1 Tax=Burkholderia cepacia TaxID=292 RepID=UPI001E640EB8|nr:putative quinol monooxygenase [Burkholderia cepacia]